MLVPRMSLIHTRQPQGETQVPAVVKTSQRRRYTGKIKNQGASLVAQWLRIRLLMQGTRVRALVWEDPTCRGATGPVSHNY